MHLLILLALASAAETFNGEVVKVKDGDSIVVNRDDGQIEIRLRDIDCPESEQPYGQQAKQQTSTLCLRKAVTVNATGQDRYGRTLAFVTLPNGKQLNRELVRIGAAWWYRKYSTDLSLRLVESQASNNKVGLWAADDPVPPWDWRASKRNNAPISADVVPNGVRIAGLLPNPTGPDRGNEQAVIANTTADAVDLRGWKLVDRAGNKFLLSGTVEQKGQLVVTMSDPTMPLNNKGDDVLLLDADGVARSKVSYTEGQVRPGVLLRFEQ